MRRGKTGVKSEFGEHLGNSYPKMPLYTVRFCVCGAAIFYALRRMRTSVIVSDAAAFASSIKCE